MPVHNSDVAEIFNKMADLLEIEGSNWSHCSLGTCEISAVRKEKIMSEEDPGWRGKRYLA